MERQVEILTKKMQLVMQENERLNKVVALQQAHAAHTQPGHGHTHSAHDHRVSSSTISNGKQVHFRDAIGPRMNPHEEPLHY